MSPLPKDPLHHPTRAFSLVEVTLCIGLLAFTMIPLVTLLGIGLQAEREAREQGAAGRIISTASSALLSATLASGEFTAAAPLNGQISWQPGGPPAEIGPIYFNAEGNITSSFTDASYALHLRVTGAMNAMQEAALVLVWPPSAVVNWGSDDRAEIEGAQGSQAEVRHLPRTNR